MTVGELRERVWNALALHRAAAYPTPPHGHHPNFVGARRAAERLMAHPAWARAEVVLAGPDQVLKPLREAALRDGKRLVLPHPDRAGRFLLLDGVPPEALRRVRDAPKYGQPVALEALPVDLVLVGSVAVDPAFGWVGKGYGFPPRRLEVGAPWATLVHPLQLLPELPVPPERRIDLIATPYELLER
ncbi:5-formyltetrahydrofolate cyclo-ligase [Marinithermus hydrothermalis]|uniref:5-formyltetrahydrofolate cyclo-ligase n=1 Tax=Marinithermus hydrothermalis TaxID=186192 RepID=UPI0005A2C624|nr:5-formyltetrahydrofolate cyclo-ligase [Marinithermus hydrothermalis]